MQVKSFLIAILTATMAVDALPVADGAGLQVRNEHLANLE